MRRWCVLILALFGCDDGSRSRIDGSEQERVDRGLLDGSPLDGSPADAASDEVPDGAPRLDMGPPANCRLEVEIIPTAHRPDFEPIVDGDTVYFTEAGPEGFDRTVRARDRAPVGGPSDRLVAARGGAFLLARQDGDGGRRLIYRDADGDVPLADRFDWPVGGEMAWRPPQWVEPGRAIFLDGGRLYRWSGGALEAVDEGVAEAALRAGRVAYVKRTADDEAPYRTVWIDGQQVWVEGSARFADDAPPRRFVSGTLRADERWVWHAGGHVVGRIGWDGEGWGEFAAPGSLRALALDVGGGGALVTMTDGMGASVYQFDPLPAPLAAEPTASTRWGVGGVVRATWAEPDAWCQPTREGSIGWSSTVYEDPTPLAPIGTGCLCCGAYWPRLTMEASDTVIAWNYAVTEDGTPGIGVARRICD